MQEIVAGLRADVAELVYWPMPRRTTGRAARSCPWRLSRAPFQAKLIKFADIIDNCASIRANDPIFFKVFATKKELILTRMLEVEGSGLADHVLFKQAWNAVTSGLSPPR
jgi:hypothetical protein